MRIFKRNPIIYTIIVVSLVIFIASAATFSGTYSWFVKTAKLDANLTGTMGNVEVRIEERKVGTRPAYYELYNDSDIDIILRIRVITEWTLNGEYQMDPPAGMPKLQLANELQLSSNWTLYDDVEGGTFLVYSGKNDFYGTGYGKLEPNTRPPIRIPNISLIPAIDAWKVELTFIAEALQATDKAYNYTITNDIDPGVTSWDLTGGGVVGP
jgi:hypothetical protein